jgi:hypothetical protein
MGRVFEVDLDGTTEASDNITTVTDESFESNATATDQLTASNTNFGGETAKLEFRGLSDFGIGDPE